MGRQDQEREAREWEAVLEGHRLTQKIKNDEESRQFRSAAAYLAGTVTIAAFLLNSDDPRRILNPYFLSAISGVNTFYLVFYSYAGAVLMQAAHFQDRISRQARDLVGDRVECLRWDAWSVGRGGRLRQIINVPLTAWRLIPLAAAFWTAGMAWHWADSGWQVLAAVVAYVLATVAGLLSFVTTIVFVLRVQHEIQTEQASEDEATNNKGSSMSAGCS